MTTTTPLPRLRTRRSLIATGAGALAAVATGTATWRALAHDGHDHGPASPAATPGTPAATPGATPDATPVAGDADAHHHEHAQGADAATGTGVGGLYLTITNAGPEPDALLGGTTDICRTVEPHVMRVDDGVATMDLAPDGLPVAAGTTITLAPQGDHVMLVDLTRDMLPDTAYDITLRFAGAGEVALTVPISWADPVAAGAPDNPVTVGTLTVSAAWSRPAPMIGG